MTIIQKKSNSWWHIFSIIGIGLIVTIPVLINSCLVSHDFGYHLIYSKYFSEQFWRGDLYP